MTTLKITFAILFILILTLSCGNDDENPVAPAANDLLGTWQYKSVTGTITVPTITETLPLNCINTTGNITLNENGTYTMTNLNSSCTYSFFGSNALLPIAVVTESGTYVRNNNSLVTTSSTGQVFNMTINEITSTRLKLGLVRTTSDLTSNVIYSLEK